MHIFYLLAFTTILSEKLNALPNTNIVRSSITTYPNGTPCSNDTSTAWVNIILLIDTSAYMGQSKLRQIGLSLSSELSKYTFGDIDRPFSSRVAIITYDKQAITQGDLFAFDDFHSISSVLLNLTASNEKNVSGMTDALGTAIEWITNLEWNLNVTYREPIIIMFSASIERADVELLEIYSMEDEAPNCFCGGAQLVGTDQQTKLFTRYADCYLLDDWFGLWDNDTFRELCSNSYPLAINSEFKSKFIQGDDQYFNSFGYTGIYLSLHRNVKKQWVWLDYNGSEVPLGNYTNWAPGHNDSNPGDCVIANDHADGNPWYWRTASCFPVEENVCSTACASLACDAAYGMLEDSQCGFGDYFLKNLKKGRKARTNIFKNNKNV